MATKPRRIDTHAHFLPDFYREELQKNGHSNPDGMPFVPLWSEEAHLEMMDNLNITRSILSISTPGVELTPTYDGPLLARRVNAFAAELIKRRPTRFGFFASLPMLDVPATLKEIETALGEGADGFCVHTNHHGHYLGDARFAPIFAELDRRRAKLFIHPTTPCIACPPCPSSSSSGADQPSSNNGSVIKATPLPKYPNPMLEFFFDTARSVTDLFLTSTVRNHASITFIIPHAGGCMPPVLERFSGFASAVPDAAIDKSITRATVLEALKRQFYFDMAGFSFPGQIRGLLEVCEVDKGRLLYGSDYPFTPAAAVERMAGVMDEGTEEWGERDRGRAYFENARDLLGE